MTTLNLKALGLIAALATTSPTLPNIGATPNVQIIDARPAKQKTNGFESVNIMRCSYGSMRIGDKEFGRDRIALLADSISNNFQSLTGRSIVVKNYVVHRNFAVNSRRMARQMTSLQIGGAIGGAIAAPESKPKVASIVGCSPDDLTGGYTSGEAGITNTPIVTVIDLEVDQRPFHFRSVSDTYKPGDQGRNGQETGEAHLQRAQTEATARFMQAFAVFLQSSASER